jgi:hypothetical protein
MFIRYLSYIVLAVMAAFLMVAAKVFALSTVAALALGVGIAMLIVSLAIVVRFRADLASVLVGAASALVSAWIVVSTLVFSNSTVDDVTFYSAIAAGVLALAGLTAHELGAERVVHSLEVHSDEKQPKPVGDGRPLAA